VTIDAAAMAPAVRAAALTDLNGLYFASRPSGGPGAVLRNGPTSRSVLFRSTERIA
jgi:hypothetical protein